MTLELAAVTFRHGSGAEMAFAKVRDGSRGAPWLDQFAFVECHRHQRVTMRGTVAGHYVDIDDHADVTGRDAAIGAVIGAIVGLALGPVGLAVGLVGGGSAGGLVDSSHVPEQRGELFDDIRAEVPEGSSAILLVSEPTVVDSMVAAFTDSGAQITRHRLPADAVAALEAAVAGAPTVAA